MSEQLWLDDQGDVRRIFAVSLNDMKKKFKAYAVYDGEKMVIQRLEEIKGWFGTWKAPLVEEVNSRRAQGFDVLVEEMSDHIARYATKQIRFEDMDESEGRVNWYLALDWFFSMHAMGLITVPKGAEQFLMREQTASKKRDEKGRLEYDLNWDVLHGAHRVILLCVLAGVLNPVSDVYFERMFGTRMERDDNDPLRSFRAITVEHDRQRAERWEPGLPGRKKNNGIERPTIPLQYRR